MGEKVEIQKTIKKVTKGNCIINFVEQTNSSGEDYLDKLHETIARLLISNYNKSKEATN